MISPTATTRRDFLRGQSLARAASDWALRAGSGAEEDRRRARAAGALLAVSRRAMACQFQILLPVTAPRAMEAAHDALDLIDRLEAQMTVYDDSSEVSRINQLAAAAPVPVEPRLFDLFETAMGLAAATEGSFDMAAGALVKAWGFFKGPKRVPPLDELGRVLEHVGSRHIELDRHARTIAFRRPGLELNLGSIGKGYALDRAAELLRETWNVPSAILHGGQSSVYALGSRRANTEMFPSGDSERVDGGESSESGDWLVAIAHPQRSVSPIATVRLQDAALGTSGSTLQYFEASGRRFGHILDPRSGWPAEGEACVSVIAPTAAEADALSTAFFILGPDFAREFCNNHAEIGAVVATVSNTVRVDISLFGRAVDLVDITH